MSSTQEKEKEVPIDTGEKNHASKDGDDLKLNRRTFIKASAAGVAAAVVVLDLKPDLGTQLQVQTQTQTSSDPFANRTITLIVNQHNYTVSVPPRAMLVNVLRENIGLIGTKRPCNRMECGGCTVLINNVPVYSCTYLAVRANNQAILTVEGGGVDKTLAALQVAWVPADASQCGYCQPGRLMAATALLKNNSNPSVPEIQAGLEGVLCRCGTYVNVIAAVQAAAMSLGGAL
jgi:aerobic-type carbon monoxide dehydrogenase small subunit (CoxS/CutS family)